MIFFFFQSSNIPKHNVPSEKFRVNLWEVDCAPYAAYLAWNRVFFSFSSYTNWCGVSKSWFICIIYFSLEIYDKVQYFLGSIVASLNAWLDTWCKYKGQKKSSLFLFYVRMHNFQLFACDGIAVEEISYVLLKI